MIDLNRGIQHPFQDQRWVSKFIIGAIVLAVPILNFAGLGWIVEHAKNASEDKDVPMPEWFENFGEKFVAGLKLFVVSILYALPLFIVWCVFALLAVVLGTLGAGSDSRSGGDFAGAAIGLMSLPTMCVVFLYSLFLAYITPAVLIQFAKTRDIGACLRFSEIFALARRNTGDYLMIFVVLIVIGFAIGLVSAILAIIPLLGWCLSFIISILAAPYLYAVVGQLCGQYMKQYALN